MTESFILAAFHRMGQRPLAVKVMRNKFTGEPAGYAFVHFQVFIRSHTMCDYIKQDKNKI